MLKIIMTQGEIRSCIMKALLGVASLSLISFALVSLDGVLLQTINERVISTRLNNMGSAVLVDRDLNIIAREGMSTKAENWADPQKIE